jgi:hypothetical protein
MMSAWNELHYSRAQEFARILAEIASGQPGAPTATVPLATPTPVPLPTPLPRPASPPAAPPPAEPATPPAKPTAASVFNKIPWKK